MADSRCDSNTGGSRRSTAGCYTEGAQVEDVYERR
jgi:hypothetical protein